MKPIEKIRTLENLDFYPLPDVYGEILNMAKMGLSVKEIACEIKMSYSRVREMVNRIIIYRMSFDGDNRWCKPLSSRAANTLRCMGLRSRIEAKLFFDNRKFNYDHYGMGKETASEIKEWAYYEPNKPARRYLYIDGARYSSAE